MATMNKAFVNSLPKSGTNLLAKCLLLFGYRERGHLSAGSVLDSDLRSRLRRIIWLSPDGPYRLGVNSPVRVRAWPINAKLRTLLDSQFISAHVGYDDGILRQVLHYNVRPIQVLRDPRAVLASFIPYVMSDRNHFLNKAFTAMDPDERLYTTLHGLKSEGIELSPMRDYCKALDPWVNHPEVLNIKFEDIVGEQGGGQRADLLTSLEKLAESLDLPRDKIEGVADNLYGPGRHTFRRGQIDSWRTELPASFVSKMNEELEPVINQWGYR